MELFFNYGAMGVSRDRTSKENEGPVIGGEAESSVHRVFLKIKLSRSKIPTNSFSPHPAIEGSGRKKEIEKDFK